MKNRTVFILLLLAISLAVFFAARCVHKATRKEGNAFVTFYHAGKGVLEGKGEAIYREIVHEAYVYPPVFAVLLAPLAGLPLGPAALVWYLLNLSLSVWSLLLCVRIAGAEREKIPPWLLALPGLLALRFVLNNLEHGQANMVIFFLTCLSLHRFRQGRDAEAGIWLALATAIKVIPALFALYFLYKREFRLVKWFLAGLLAFLLLPALVFGFEMNLKLIGLFFDAAILPYLSGSEILVQPINQSMAAFLKRFLSPAAVRVGKDTMITVNLLSLDGEALHRVVTAASAATLGVMAWLCRGRIRGRERTLWSLEFSLVLLASLFLSGKCWKYYYASLLLPYAAALLPLRKGLRRKRALFWGALLCAILTNGTAPSLVGENLSDRAEARSVIFVGSLFLWTGIAVQLEREKRHRIAT